MSFLCLKSFRRNSVLLLSKRLVITLFAQLVTCKYSSRCIGSYFWQTIAIQWSVIEFWTQTVTEMKHSRCCTFIYGWSTPSVGLLYASLLFLNCSRLVNKTCRNSGQDGVLFRLSYLSEIFCNGVIVRWRKYLDTFLSCVWKWHVFCLIGRYSPDLQLVLHMLEGIQSWAESVRCFRYICRVCYNKYYNK